MACRENTDKDMEQHESDKMHVTSLRNYQVIQLQDVSCDSLQQQQNPYGKPRMPFQANKRKWSGRQAVETHLTTRPFFSAFNLLFLFCFCLVVIVLLLF